MPNLLDRTKTFLNKSRSIRKITPSIHHMTYRPHPDAPLVFMDEYLKSLDRRLKDLESRPVTTTYEGDHEAISLLAKNNDEIHKSLLNYALKIGSIDKRINNLESAPISKKIRAITARTSKSKTKRNGRMAGRHANP